MEITNKQFCELIGITEEQFSGKEEIEDFLSLDYLTFIPEGFNPIVSELRLSSVTSLPDGFSPIVKGALYLNNLTSLPKGFSPEVGGPLYLPQIDSIPEDFAPVVGGCLSFGNLTSLPDGFNPVVGGSIYLSNLTSLPPNNNLIVGERLYLKSLIAPKGFNAMADGEFKIIKVLKGTECEAITVLAQLQLETSQYYFTSPPNFNNAHSWRNGEYIKANDVFIKVIAQKGNIYKGRIIGRTKECVLITDGSGVWAEGDTLRKAKNNLVRSKINRSKFHYNLLTIDNELTFEESIEVYKDITGVQSCEVQRFLEKHPDIEKKIYKISEIIELTKGEYGNKVFETFIDSNMIIPPPTDTLPTF